jgi:hypothetical protein
MNWPNMLLHRRQTRTDLRYGEYLESHFNILDNITLRRREMRKLSDVAYSELVQDRVQRLALIIAELNLPRLLPAFFKCNILTELN